VKGTENQHCQTTSNGVLIEWFPDGLRTTVRNYREALVKGLEKVRNIRVDLDKTN
jgi:hypothetical protein